MKREPLDALGAVLVTLGFSAVVVFLTEVSARGWTNSVAIGFLVVGVLSLAGFGVWESRTSVPLLPLSFLARRGTIGTSIAIATMWAAYTEFAFLATLGMQNTLGWSALQAGLAFVPLGIVNGALAPTMGRFAGRFGAGRLVLIGIVLLNASYALFFRMGPDASFLGVFLPIMVVNGLGLACAFAPLNLAAMDAADPIRRGLAASVLSTSQQLGGAIGLALVAAIAGASTTDPEESAATAAVVAISIVGTSGSALLLRRRPS